MQVGYANKDKTLPPSDVRRKFRDVDANELKNAINTNDSEQADKIQDAIDDNQTDLTAELEQIQEDLVSKVTLSNIVKRETPAGAVPGSAFTTAFPLVAGSEELFKNGQLLDTPTSYTMTGQNIALVIALETEDSLKINYIKL